MKRILVWQTAFLGDVVLVTPLIRALAKIFPGCAIDTVTIPGPDKLMQDLPWVDQAIAFDKKGADSGFAGMRNFISRLRRQEYSTVVSAHRSSRTSLSLLLSGIERRIGFADSAAAICYTYRTPRDKSLHEAERVISLLRGFGEDPTEYYGPLYLEVNREAEQTVDALLAEYGAGDSTLVGLNPGSVWGTKRWPADRFAAVADQLSEHYNLTPVIIGGPADIETAEQVIEQMNRPVINLAGKTDLRELVALIDRMRILVTNDSGPMHIGVARKVGVVAIFGATDRSLGYYPYDRSAIIVETDLECRPCSDHGPMICPLEHFKCMRNVRPEAVIEACRTILESREAER